MTPGNPIQMRSGAASLLVHADRLRAVAAGIGERTESMVYSGPAAVRFHDSIRSQVATLSRSASELEHVAGILVRSAAVVEQQQAQDAALRAAGIESSFGSGGGHANPG